MTNELRPFIIGFRDRSSALARLALLGQGSKTGDLNPTRFATLEEALIAMAPVVHSYGLENVWLLLHVQIHTETTATLAAGTVKGLCAALLGQAEQPEAVEEAADSA